MPRARPDQASRGSDDDIGLEPVGSIDKRRTVPDDAELVHRCGGGLGLLSIEERARLHGSVRIETAGQRGTIVRVAIPAAATRPPAAEFC